MVEQGQEKRSGNRLYLKQEMVFFLHVKIPGDTEAAKQSKIDCMYKKDLIVQPYIIVVGSDLNVHSFYVIIDNKHYETSMLLDALKFCFQTYFVLDMKYPPES